MGENRAEVLQRIGVMANVRDIEITEQADIVAVLSRFLYGDQGEMICDVFRVVDEVVNLCHGAREQNHHAIESRRRVLELEAREHAGPVAPPGPPVQFNLNAAGHAHPAVEEEDTAGGGEFRGRR